MKQIWLGSLFVLAATFYASSAGAACGDLVIDGVDQCDDGNTASGDGCSSTCVVESGFVCENVTTTLAANENLGEGGSGAPNWVVDADNRGVLQTTNSHAAVFDTLIPAAVGEIVFDVRVETTNDDDFFGWTIGYDPGEMSTTATSADFLYFSWKQNSQSNGGAGRVSGLGLTRVSGAGTGSQYWANTGGNLTFIDDAINYDMLDDPFNRGWADNTWYRINLIVTGTRVRVWVRQGNTTAGALPGARGFPALNRVTHLEFDIPFATGVPTGSFGFFAYSQDQVRFDLVTAQSVCGRDLDSDGVPNTRDLDADRDGVLDRVEMPGFTSDPDDDSDIDGVPDWRDPDFSLLAGCPSSGGTCTTLPVTFDTDADGVPNHLDRDSDGDGLPDTTESGLTDVTADGVPDACTTVTAVGVCVSGGLAAGVTPPDTDARGGANAGDLDSDADGIPDSLEAGLTDANVDGRPDACTSVNAFGMCVMGGLVGAAALPNTDMTGAANYADRDSDGDGITDAREAGLLDGNGDGVPNACTSDLPAGLCNAGGLAAALPSTDADTIPDYLDVDSDADGLTDTIEAYDSDGNATTNRPPVGLDTDNDGIDNAFDPECTPALCSGVTGLPVVTPLTAAQDANANGVPDWLTVCGDAYLTGSEPCDDGNLTDTDTCNNACLVTLTNPCTTGTQCASGICNGTTCATCVNNSAAGTDTGCSAALPACVTSGASSLCTECDVNAQCGAEICSPSTNLCEVCVDNGAGTDLGCGAGTPNCIGVSGARQCVQCTSNAQCNDGVACTTDVCMSNACVNTAVAAGGTGGCTGGQVCTGAPANQCVVCTDTSASGTDSGCTAGVPHCGSTMAGAPVCQACLNTASGSATDLGCSTGTPYCVTGSGGTNSCAACLTSSDCNDSNTCTSDVCTAGVCSNPTVTAGTACAGGVCNGTVPALCEICVDNGSGTDLGCGAATPNCIGASGARQCVECTANAQCNDGIACTTDTCVSNACENTPVAAGGAGSCTSGQVCSGAPSNQCIECTDSSTTGTDAGCAAGAPHCRTSGTNAPVCEPCVNTESGSATDLGCSTGTPYCVTTPAGVSSCAACLTNSDCNDSNSCTSDVCTAGACSNPTVTAGTACAGGVCNGTVPALCEICVDNGSGTDVGCSAATPNCIGASGARQCVECTANAQCNDGIACTTDTCASNACENTAVAAGGAGSCTSGQVCSGAPSNQCIECTDSSLTGTDAGCAAGAPHCRTSGTNAPVCEPCVNTASGSATDLGCSTGTPYCVTTPAGVSACTACLMDSDCNDNNSCTSDSCTAGVCSNPTVPAGTSCAGGVCNGQTPALCEVCVDSGSGTDTGCTGATPNCIGASGARQCVECTADAQCSDGVACTTDTCTSNACVNAAVAAGSTGGCTGGQVCSGEPTNLCIECTDSSPTDTDAGCAPGAPHCRSTGTGAPVCEPCVNNASGSAADLGCSTAAPYCVTSAGGVSSCTACLTEADCNDNNTCTSDVCTAGVCSNPTETAGTACSGGVCNGAVPAICEACVDSGTGTDAGCTASNPSCVGASGARQCVECTANSQCSDGIACTTDTCVSNACVYTAVAAGGVGTCTGGQVCSGPDANLCVACADNSEMGTDAGCAGGLPHCRVTGMGAPLCEPCINSVPGSAPDLGCSMATPYCVTGTGGTSACAACVTDTDCSDGNTCTTDVCMAGVCANPAATAGTNCADGVCSGTEPALCEFCVDSGTGTDAGCTMATPNCIGVSGARECVECTADAQCNDDVACTTDTCADNACANTSVAAGGAGMCASGQVCSGAPSDMCVACADTGMSGTDAGCSASEPFCDVDAGGGNNCEVCIDGGAGTDPGCGDATPNCVVGSGGENECASCLTNADCNDGNECTSDVCTTGMCTNPALTEFSPCSAGVCTEASVCSTVAVAIETPMEGSTISDPTPTVSGTGTPGTTVMVSIGGMPAGMVEVMPDGTWTLELPMLADGPNTVTAAVTVGALMASDTASFTLDTGTEVAITDPADGSTITDSTPLILGTGEPGASVVISIDGMEVGMTTVLMNGVWFLIVPDRLANGDHIIVAEATDESGNMASATSMVTIESNTDIDITLPIDGAVISDNTPTISGTSLPNASISVVLSNLEGEVFTGTATEDGNGVWTFDVTDELEDGLYFVTATAEDTDGNIASDTSTFTVDTVTSVTIESADPASGTISGTGEPGAEVVVTINGVVVGMATVGLDGTWTLDTDGFNVGQNTVTATATDAAGNTATDTETVTVAGPDAGMPDAGGTDGGSGGGETGEGGLSGGALCATHSPASGSWPAGVSLLMVGLALAIRRRR